ncbi:hypothetical protein ACFE04_009740 [Oxalis oulophora]
MSYQRIPPESYPPPPPGYQGYFADGCPPPPPPPGHPQYNQYHCDHHHYDNYSDDGCFSFLRGCFLVLRRQSSVHFRCTLLLLLDGGMLLLSKMNMGKRMNGFVLLRTA